MPTIRFAKGRPSIEVESGANLMQALTSAGLPVASSCSGEGVCAKCRIKITDGAQHLSPPNALEKDLCEINDVPRNERISCQTQVLGDVTVDTRYW